MATKYLINPSGVMIKPKNKGHMLELLNKGGGWATHPETGEPIQKGGGFRLATEQEVETHLANWKAQAAKMHQLDMQAKKQNAQLVLMAPDEATLERVIESREERKRAAEGAAGKSKKKAKEEADA